MIDPLDYAQRKTNGCLPDLRRIEGDARRWAAVGEAAPASLVAELARKTADAVSLIDQRLQRLERGE